MMAPEILAYSYPEEVPRIILAANAKTRYLPVVGREPSS